MATRKIKLRAFKIENNNPANKQSPLLKMLSSKLTNSKNINERRISINKDDAEEDCISNFDDARKSIFLSWTIIRIAVADSVKQINSNDFSMKKAPIEILNAVGNNNNYVCKNICYFATDGENIVTNLPTNRTITSYQTYLNEYLKNERGVELFEFTPIVCPPPDIKVKDLKSISFSPQISKINKEKNNIDVSFLDIAKDKLSGLLDIVPNFDKFIESEVLSVELVIKFAKGKKDTDDYNELLGKVIKPVADLESITFEKKNKEKITGEEILKTKLVEIELTENKYINEGQLYQEMERFLNELKR